MPERIRSPHRIMTCTRPAPLLRCIPLLAAALVLLMFPPAADARRKTLALFNGRDLTNFYTWLVDHRYEDPDRVFRVEPIDGAPAIRVTGKHFGAFITRQEFADYHLTAEYSWGHATWGSRKRAAKDSGILLQCQGRDGNTSADFNGPWMLSQECQIIEGGTGDFIMVGGHDDQGRRIVPSLTVTAGRDRDGEPIYDPTAPPREFRGGRVNWFGRDPDWRDALGFRGNKDVETPGNGWTRVEVICDGDSITNIVNGTVVNKGTRSSLTRGKIIFQSEGAEIYFRKVELTPLR